MNINAVANKFKNSKIKIVIISILIAIFIEIFVCNFPMFRTLFANSKNINANYSIFENKVVISNINERITNINFYYKNELTDKITYKVKYLAEENSDLISLRDKVILQNQKQYINLDTHSKCKNLEIEIITDSDLELENIILNHVNFNFSIIRVLLLFIIIVFFIKVRNKSIYTLGYNSEDKLHNYRFMLNLIVLCSFLFLYVLCQYNTDKLLIKPEDINKEDSILMQTEAFVNGSISLLEPVPDELKNMENPYDNVKREEVTNYLYDVAYYDGNYYNYFGIAPIITSILPFRLITGMYTHTYIFNMIYILGIAISLSFLYKKLVDKYVKKISLSNFYLGFYAIFFGANIITLFRGAKYDIVVSSGIMFLLISMNLAMSIYKNPKYKYLKLIFLGISLALVVLSKPNLIIYYFIVLYLLLESMKELSLKEKLKDGIFIAVPLGIFAIFQMIYNYMRFDNIFEFGAKYQLTSFNMTYCMSFTFGKMFAGIFEYIFRTPQINPLVFPFVFINTETSLVSMNEVCYENRLVGLIAIPILFVYLFANNILKVNKDKSFSGLIKIILIISFISIILNTCLGGICEAYSIDFKLMLCLGAIMLLLKAIEQEKDNTYMNKIFLILCILTISIMLPIGLTTESNFLLNLKSSTTIFFKNIFEFWV